MVNKTCKIILLSLILILLSGCWDYEDINNKSITLSLGIDKKDEEIIFNGEIAKLLSGANKGGATASVTDVYQFTAEGKDFEGTRYDFDYKIPTMDFSGAVISVVFSKEYAEEIGIESYTNRFSFIPGFRPSALVVVSEQHTGELFKEKVLNNISTGHSIQDTIRYLEKDGVSIYTTIQNVRQNIAFKEIGFLLPYIKKYKDTIEYLGFAVIKNSKFIGMIKADDSRGAVYLINNKASYNQTIPHPQNKANLLAIRTKLKKRKITTSYNESEIRIDIKLDLSSNILYEYIKEPISKESIKELESIIEKRIKQDVVSILQRSQKEFRCDFFGFARYFKADNHIVFKTIDWEEEYPDIRFNVEVNSKIVNYNLINTKVKKSYKDGIE